jgi:3-methyladenine DNA glycosylase AlkC
MKDGIDRQAVLRISKALRKASPDFDEKGFQHLALDGIEKLELKQRISHLIGALHSRLPEDFEKTAKTLALIPRYWDRGDENNPLAGFAAWPLIDYVGHYGLDHPVTSLQLLKSLTTLFSAEFAIRPFVKSHFEITYKLLERWCGDENEHVRRLVSEGTRPRLPWGERLPQFIKNPDPVIKLLERLKDDPSEYVRRSVANNLNDISKDHPELVLRLCSDWNRKASKERKWIIRQATRSLVKTGHPEVFSLLGYTENPEIEIRNYRVDKSSIKIGDTLGFSFDISSTAQRTQSFVLDYAVHYVKSNGTTSSKVFKIKAMKIGAEQTISVTKTHSFREVTTRRHYDGNHAIELLINGVAFGCLNFRLIA